MLRISFGALIKELRRGRRFVFIEKSLQDDGGSLSIDKCFVLARLNPLQGQSANGGDGRKPFIFVNNWQA
jgi:hypothetical protein